MSGQPSERVKRLVWARAMGRCERCGLDARASWDGYSYHHRRIKGMGGDKRPDTQEAQNLLLLCGSGTTGCHGWAHHDVTGQAREMGFIVSRWADPLVEPVASFLRGRVVLQADGGWGAAPLT